MSSVGRKTDRFESHLSRHGAHYEAVAELAAKVDRACVSAGLETEQRAFHPHVTIARWRRGGAQAAEAFERRHSDLASAPFAVEAFILFESHLSRHGAHYEEAARFGLEQN